MWGLALPVAVSSDLSDPPPHPTSVVVYFLKVGHVSAHKVHQVPIIPSVVDVMKCMQEIREVPFWQTEDGVMKFRYVSCGNYGNKQVFGLQRDEVAGEWRRLHNEELRVLYSSPNIN